jgi:Peptidase_C39 like family
MTKKHYDPKKVKHFHQHDNAYSPQGTCNFTSVAMCLTGFGFVGGGGRFPDEIYQKYNHDYSRHDPLTLKKILEDYGLKDDFSFAQDWDDVLEHLFKKKLPVILHGDFTESGHIIFLKTTTPDGMIVANDPNGVFDAHTGFYNTSFRGENDWWSPKSLLKWANYDQKPGTRSVWAHLVSG